MRRSYDPTSTTSNSSMLLVRHRPARVLRGRMQRERRSWLRFRTSRMRKTRRWVSKKVDLASIILEFALPAIFGKIQDDTQQYGCTTWTVNMNPAHFGVKGRGARVTSGFCKHYYGVCITCYLWEDTRRYRSNMIAQHGRTCLHVTCNACSQTPTPRRTEGCICNDRFAGF